MKVYVAGPLFSEMERSVAATEAELEALLGRLKGG